MFTLKMAIKMEVGNVMTIMMLSQNAALVLERYCRWLIYVKIAPSL